MNRLTPAARKYCLAWLKSATSISGPSAVPNLGLDARIKLTRHPSKPTADGALLILERDGIAYITYHLCIHSVRAQQMWTAATSVGGKFSHAHGIGLKMPETVPWLLAILLLPAAELSAETLRMCPDFAACVATILLEKEAKGEITPWGKNECGGNARM